MIVYHYTTSEKLNSIYADGLLLPSAIGIGNREIPIVWFSSNPRWEPTANKSIGYRANGLDVPVRPLTTSEMAGMFTLVRFGIHASRTLPWHQLRKAARIAHTEQRRLIRRARRVGSTPIDWFGSLDPIPIAETIREDMNPSREWVLNEIDHADYLQENRK
jgi:hypothetical protein